MIGLTRPSSRQALWTGPSLWPPGLRRNRKNDDGGPGCCWPLLLVAASWMLQQVINGGLDSVLGSPHLLVSLAVDGLNPLGSLPPQYHCVSNVIRVPQSIQPLQLPSDVPGNGALVRGASDFLHVISAEQCLSGLAQVDDYLGIAVVKKPRQPEMALRSNIVR
jgi:hypothetical protein